jgi:fructose-bisphosphate aldolase class II
MLCTTDELIHDARSKGVGIAAFNVITLEHAEGIAEAAESTCLPAILQISENASRFHGGPSAIAAACIAVARGSSANLSVHFDHIEDEELLERVLGCGASSVMFDASKLEDEANVAATKRAAQWAHDRGMFIEAELGEIGGKGGAHTPGVRTDPAQAALFVERTGIDALAVAVGSSHAMTERTASLDFELISRLRDALPVPLVLHGSSGVSNDELSRAVQHGMVKINIGTLLNVAFTQTIRPLLSEGSLVDPRKYLAPARSAIAAAAAESQRAISGLQPVA